MAYEILRKKDHVEVRIWGEASTVDYLEAFLDLQRADPTKCVPDMWVISQDSVVPFTFFRHIVRVIGLFCKPGLRYVRSAIVVTDQFQLAQAELYREAAAELPYETGVFTCEKSALVWLMDGDKPVVLPDGSGNGDGDRVFA